LSPATLPGSQRIFLDFCNRRASVAAGLEPDAQSPLARWYANWNPSNLPASVSTISPSMLALLAAQNSEPGQQAALDRLRAGARTLVTGQQVGLFGGTALIPFKAATAIAQAAQASQRGIAHQPIFWLATEDHDFAEIDHLVLPDRRALVRLHYNAAPDSPVPVGTLQLTDAI
jgi:hypothetical protein